MQEYEELGLGPLLRNTIIQRSFTPPQNITSIPQITTQEVIKEFQKFFFTTKRSQEVKVSKNSPQVNFWFDTALFFEAITSEI